MLKRNCCFSNCKLNYVKDLHSALVEQGASLVALMVKNLPAMQETQVQSLGEEDILVKGNTPVFLPGRFHRQRSLAGYSPWGHRKLDMAEQLAFSLLIEHRAFEFNYSRCSFKRNLS